MKLREIAQIHMDHITGDKIMKLREIAQIHMGYTFRGSLKNSTQGNTAIIQMRDAWQEGVEQPTQFARAELKHISEHYLLGPGDLIFRSRGSVNTCALIIQPQARTICIAPMMFIRITRPDLILPAYLQWFINLSGIQAQISTYARGSAVRMIAAQSMEGLDVVLPTLQSQQQILVTLELNQQILVVEAELANNRKHFNEQALLQFARRNVMQVAA